MANPYEQAANIAAPYAGMGTQILAGANAYERGKTHMQSEMAKQFAMQQHGDMYGAQAGKMRAEADTINQRRQYQTPEFGAQIAATMNGLSPEIGQQIASGNIPQGITPEQVQSFNRGRGAHFAQLGATGDTNADQMVKAFASLLGQGRTDQAINNPKMAATIAQGVAAGNGDALISNLGGNGVFNQFTGGQELNAVGKSSANQNNAAAGNQSAMASLHRAQIPEVQSRIDLNRSKIGGTETVTNLDGTTTVISSGKAAKPLTESQAKATAFLGQMRSAEDLLSTLEKDQSKIGQQADVKMAGGLLNIAASPKAQQIGQAQNQWSEAFLRFKTGAAATPDEVRINNMTFFPQIGDKPEVVEQKQKMRKQAANDMTIVSGPGAGQITSVYADQAKKPQTLNLSDKTASVLAARKAISDGRDRAEVIKRLEAAGITDHGIK